MPRPEVYVRMIGRAPWPALLLLVTACAPLWATEGPEFGTPRVVLAMPGLQSCRFADERTPGGPALVCGREDAAAFEWEILRVPLEGGGSEVIGYGRQPDLRGSKLAWVGTGPGCEGVWLDDLADDEPPVRLTDSLEMTQPSIAADGRTVACTREARRQTGIFVVRPGVGGAGERIAYRGERQPVWGPEGVEMLAIKTDQVWLLQAPRWEELVSERLTDVGMVHFDPAWGPEGEWIVFAAGWSVERAALALMHLPSRRTWRPHLAVSGVRSPVISPDGRKLAFVAGEGETAAVYLCELRLP
jgi:Tol biopolymer transport system component